MATAAEITKVNATFTTLAKIANVLIYYPKINDPYLKLIAEHHIELPGLSEPVFIPDNFRRGDVIDGKKFVTKHYFVKSATDSFTGEKRTANVEVVLKKDHSRNDEESIIINVTQAPIGRPEWDIKVGTEKSQPENCFAIPGTNKFVTFKKRQ